MMKTLCGLCELIHFGSLTDLNGKKALATVQHLYGPLLRDTHKLLPPHVGTERL